ncbi:MAG: hypothetical protein COZ56_18570 [Armatimonadetes bacterium CG_4_8_14_3_um_filter_58_9]|nr:MAG: hypothetical protein COZ56_18570 [Armatimonadetes bacterium CG_4_8_14_3_um_filter_58_9]
MAPCSRASETHAIAGNHRDSLKIRTIPSKIQGKSRFPMISRLAQQRIQELAELFPCVVILGPRQCGKTTLAKGFLKGHYFDLEKPSDRQVFESDVEFGLRQFPEPLILDEAQSMPELFGVLRGLIDEKRDQSGRFYLLGSVNPDLVKGISESLAGRVGTVDLTPFLYSEVASTLGRDVTSFWFHGGFPDPCQLGEGDAWSLWQENYVRTFVERDIPRQGGRLSPIQVRQMMSMLAHLHGKVLNASDLSRSAGISYHSIQNYIDLVEGHFLLYRLPSYQVNVAKRLVRSPKVYYTDSGLLHYLLGIRNRRGLFESPYLGPSWEGFVIGQIISMERLFRTGSQFSFYRTQAGAEIDLILERGDSRTGFEVKFGSSVTAGDIRNLRSGISEGLIHRGWVIHAGERTFAFPDSISAVGAEEFLLNYRQMVG